jgi:hypothetical protein
MLRSLLLGAAAAVTLSTTAAMADAESDCRNGIDMIRAESEGEGSKVLREAFRRALSNAEHEMEKQAWSECIKYSEFVRGVFTAEEQARRAQEEAKEWKPADKVRAASDKSLQPCEQGRYWCAKRAWCIKIGTQCQYLQGDFGGRGLQRH